MRPLHNSLICHCEHPTAGYIRSYPWKKHWHFFMGFIPCHLERSERSCFKISPSGRNDNALLTCFLGAVAKTHFGRIAEMDVLYVHPKGEGHGWPESLPLFRGRGIQVHHERKVRFRVKNQKYRRNIDDARKN